MLAPDSSSAHVLRSGYQSHITSAASLSQAEVVKAAVGRLFDEQESVRKAATAAVATLLQVRCRCWGQHCQAVRLGSPCLPAHGMPMAMLLVCCMRCGWCSNACLHRSSCAGARITSCVLAALPLTAVQSHPELAGSKATEGRGSVLSCLIGRLRDKKAAVRREAASQAAAVMRAWVLASAADPGSAPRIEMILGIPLVLCNLAVRDTELGTHTFDVVFRAGIFPAKLPPADVARYWALLWKQAGKDGRGRGGTGCCGGQLWRWHTACRSCCCCVVRHQLCSTSCLADTSSTHSCCWVYRRGGAAGACQDLAGRRPGCGRAARRGGLVLMLCAALYWLPTFWCVLLCVPPSSALPPCLLRYSQGKAAVQGRVQELLALRAAAKEARTSSLAGAGR